MCRTLGISVQGLEFGGFEEAVYMGVSTEFFLCLVANPAGGLVFRDFVNTHTRTSSLTYIIPLTGLL